MSPEVVLVCGLPGAGKSTWCREKLEESHVVVSKDRMPRSSRKQARQDREIRAAVALGRAVVVDNTNLTRAARAPVIQIAVEVGGPCRAVVLATPLDVALARNAARTGDARVPDGIVRQMARDWEPPSSDEGLLEVLWVGG